MGAWRFLSTRLREAIGQSIELIYVGRPESASPAEGFGPRHAAEQNRIITAALSDVPDAKSDAPPAGGNGKRNGNGRETGSTDAPTALSTPKRSEPTHAR